MDDINYPNELASVFLNIEADLLLGKSIKKYQEDINKMIDALETLIQHCKNENDGLNVEGAELMLIRFRQFEMKAKYMK